MSDATESRDNAMEDRANVSEHRAAESGAGADTEPGRDSPAGDAESEHLRAELDELRTQLEGVTDRHLRLAAEFDNYRKRVDRERVEIGARAQAELLESLLDVLDDLERVSEFTPEKTSVEALLEGVELIERKMHRKLAAAGLETLNPAGEFFDPTTMEALATTPAGHPEEDEVVAAVFQKGYRFRDILVRPARVQVRKYDG